MHNLTFTSLEMTVQSMCERLNSGDSYVTYATARTVEQRDSYVISGAGKTETYEESYATYWVCDEQRLETSELAEIQTRFQQNDLLQ